MPQTTTVYRSITSFATVIQKWKYHTKKIRNCDEDAISIKKIIQDMLLDDI